MPEQQYSNHVRLSTPYHLVLLPILVLGLIGSLVNLWQSAENHERLYSSALIVLIMLALPTIALFSRVFALRAQDRAIRAEENLRHFAMTGALLDPRVTTKQVVGLRFASDAELVALAKRAAEQGLSQRDIKQAIKNWRADDHRV